TPVSWRAPPNSPMISMRMKRPGSGGRARGAGGMDDAHDVGLAAQVQQHRKREPGHRVAPHFGGLIEAAMSPRHGRGSLDALLQGGARQMQDGDRYPEIVFVLRDPQLQRPGVLGAGYEVIDRREVNRVALPRQ